jgi:RNA polymerase sigma factor (sigma-70 family)
MIDTDRLERIVRCPSVRRACLGAPLAEDAVQEARIAVWGVMEKRPDVADSYLYAVATKAALSLLTGRKATGAPERTKMSGSPVSNASLDDLMDAEESSWEPPTTTWEDATALELSVQDALADLEPRDQALIHLRFWEGHPESTAAKMLGYSRARAYQRWQSIRPVLAERLAS